MKLRKILGLSAIALLASGATARAQLSTLLERVVSPDKIVSDSGRNVVPNHEAHFQISDDAAGAGNLGYFLSVASINQAVITQLTSLPLGSSSGGFTYTFDEELNTFDRTSNSFGPSLAERALTNGKGKFGFGVNIIAANFDSLDGRNLEDGDIRLYLQHNDCCPGQVDGSFGDGTRLAAPFEGDVIESAISLSVDTQSTVFFMNYGITDRLDLAVMLPFNRVDLRATNLATLQRLSTAGNTNIHFFSTENSAITPDIAVESAEVLRISASDSAVGIGDIAIRGKWNFFRRGESGIAAGLEVRLPTGDEEELLGLGASQGRFTLIGSSNIASFSPHFNVSYRVTGDPSSERVDRMFREQSAPGAGQSPNSSDLVQTDRTVRIADFDLAPNELSYAVGFDWAAAPRLTFAADILGRRLFDAGRLGVAPITHGFRTLGDATPRQTPLPQPDVLSEDVDQVFAAVGGKVNLGSTFLLSINVMFQLNDQGLKAPVVPVIGLDYLF